MDEYTPPFVLHNKLLVSEITDYLEHRIEELQDLGVRDSVTTVAKEQGIGRKQVLRYRRLKRLNREFRNAIDKLEITVDAGYELSFLPCDYQSVLLLFLSKHNLEMKCLRLSLCRLIHSSNKNDLVLFEKKLNDFFNSNFFGDERRDYNTLKALDYFFNDISVPIKYINTDMIECL